MCTSPVVVGDGGTSLVEISWENALSWMDSVNDSSFGWLDWVIIYRTVALITAVNSGTGYFVVSD